jgi:sentrin-specific protease 7
MPSVASHMFNLTPPSETLGKKFNRAMEEAIKHSTLNNRQALPGTNDLFHKAKKREASVEHVERPTKQPQIEQVFAPRSQRLKDRMLPSAPVPTLPRKDVKVLYQPGLENVASATRRRTRQSILNLDEHEDIKWTTQNSKWQDNWQTSLVFPATGKNRTTVDAEDIVRLDEGEFLNDNLISFYLRYLQVELEKTRPELLTKVHIFSSFFFEKLRSTKGKINYDGVRNWTAKIDLFSYDYIVVPVNEHAHWYLAIICNVGKTLPKAEAEEVEAREKGEPSVDKVEVSFTMPVVEERVKLISLEDDQPTSSLATQAEDEVVVSSPAMNSPAINNSTAGRARSRRSFGSSQKFDPDDPRIITLDSLGSAHAPTCKALREYIAEEARHKKSLELRFSLPGMTGKGIPEQDNFCDCGVFVLAYMEEFLKDPDGTARKLLQKEPIDWAINPSSLRSKIRDLLFDLQKAQQIRLTQEKDAKRAAAWKKKQAELGRVKRSSESTTPTTPPKALVAKTLPVDLLESARHDAPPDALPSEPQSDGHLEGAESEVSSKALASKVQSNGTSDETEPVTPSEAQSLDKSISTRRTSPQLAMGEANTKLNAGENHTDELPQPTPPRNIEKSGITTLLMNEIKFVSPLKDDSSPYVQRRGSATPASELAKDSARSETPRKKKKRSRNKKKKKKNEAVSSVQPIDKASSSEPDSSEGEDKATCGIRPSVEAGFDDEQELSRKETQRKGNEDLYIESAYFKPKTDAAGCEHTS